jgi:hypothetical protein
MAGINANLLSFLISVGGSLTAYLLQILAAKGWKELRKDRLPDAAQLSPRYYGEGVEERIRTFLPEAFARVSEAVPAPEVERALYELLADPVFEKDLVSRLFHRDDEARQRVQDTLVDRVPTLERVQVDATLKVVCDVWDKLVLEDDLLARLQSRERDIEIDRKLSEVLKLLAEDRRDRPTEEEYQRGKERYLQKVGEECRRIDLYALLGRKAEEASLPLPLVYVPLYATLANDVLFDRVPPMVEVGQDAPPEAQRQLRIPAHLLPFLGEVKYTNASYRVTTMTPRGAGIGQDNSLKVSCALLCGRSAGRAANRGMAGNSFLDPCSRL